jgi:hypothetical protein
MLSETMQRKLKSVARRWDDNGDGFVEEDDYAIAAGRLAALSGYPSDSPEYGGILRALMAGWELMRQFDTDGDGRVSPEECLGGFEAIHADPARYEEVIVAPSKGIFDLLDADHDGRISAAEHEAFLRAFNASDDEVSTSFAHIDFDEDGYLSRVDFLQLVDQFFRSDDPDLPGTWLFGQP